MDKFCVFCGKPPVIKTKEHILPKWLIKITGNPGRKAFFGYYQEDDKLREMHIAFDKYQFPACKQCNEDYSELEARIQKVILSLLSEEELNSADFNLLLTWLDKIRIGLWLATLYYNNPLGIDPNFYINQGTFQRDRLLFLYKYHKPLKRLNFAGLRGYGFQILPSCFSLLINNYAFFNLASTNLLSKGLGLPFPKADYVFLRGGLRVLENGTEKVEYPLIDKEFNNTCTEFYQPIIADYGKDSYIKQVSSEYHKKIFIKRNPVIGKILFFKDNELKKFPSKNNNEWIPPTLPYPNVNDFFKFIAIQTYETQNFYLRKGVKTPNPKLQQKIYKDRAIALVMNNLIIKKLKKV